MNLANTVTGGGIANILWPQHRDGPAVHCDVLGGCQEVKDGEHGGQRGHVRHNTHLQMSFKATRKDQFSLAVLLH